MNWEVDHIRCAEMFYRRQRADSFLVKLPNGKFMLARPYLFFSCQCGGKEWHLARVAHLKTILKPDEGNIRMRVVQDQPFGEIIDVSWIVRSISLAPTFEKNKDDEWFVNDLLDPDLFFRLLPLNITDCIL
jgi:hypothetical protein